MGPRALTYEKLRTGIIHVFLAIIARYPLSKANLSTALLCLILTLTACGPDRDAQRNPVDYDAMNLRALGPAQPITPEPIGASELVGIGPFTCVVPGQGYRELLFVATPSLGAMRLKGDNVRFAPAPSDDTLPYDISERFTGQTYTVELSVDPQTETPAGPELVYFLGEMIVRDARDRIVFEHRGRIECGAAG